jgi:hypothetical protein
MGIMAEMVVLVFLHPLMVLQQLGPAVAVAVLELI